MILTFTIEIDKDRIKNFSELIILVKCLVFEIGRKIILEFLTVWDAEVNDNRDKKRYRNKGKKKTSVKTCLGCIEYLRNAYIDNYYPQKKGYTFLLDEQRKIKETGLFASDICEMVCQLIPELTYRKTAETINELTGVSISSQGVWKIVQNTGNKLDKKVKANAKLAKNNKLHGPIESKLLYEERDGVWLHLQGKSRKKHGPSGEMKVGICYDGVTWEECKKNKKRRVLHNKVAYAAIKPSSVFKANTEGVIASTYNVDEVELRIINGDGAQWIQKNNTCDCVCVLDKFHRNKELRKRIKDQDTVKTISNLLYAGDVETVLKILEALINSIEDPYELNDVKELYSYYFNNRNALLDPYQQIGEKNIPPTSEPGVIHHSRLGTMESNIFTLVTNRMKRGRMSWSENGANNLALILCQYHTNPFDKIFGTKEYYEKPEAETISEASVLSAAQIKLSTGSGYEAEHSVHSVQSSWINKVFSLKTFAELN